MRKRTVTTAWMLGLMVAGAAWAGLPTRDMAHQPGGEEAAAVDASVYASLQEALDALPDSGGVLSLPPGRYEVMKPVVCRRGDVAIRGAGTATHIANTNTEGKPAFHFLPPEGEKSIWRVHLCDFRVTGNPESGSGILAEKVDELLISRVSAEHNGGDGITLDHCLEDARVCDSLMTYNARTGLNLLGCHDIVVSANQFEENQDALHCIRGYNLTMTGNNLDDHLGDGVIIESTYGSVVASNMIEECNGHAIVLRGACYGDAISANTLAHCRGDGVRLEGVRDITISANTFVLLRQEGVHARDGAARLTISANTFCRYPFHPDKRRKEDPGGGVRLEGAHDVTISGNSFYDTRREAVWADGARLNITGNTIVDPGWEMDEPCAAIALMRDAVSLVVNNIITYSGARPARALVVPADSAGITLQNNIVSKAGG